MEQDHERFVDMAIEEAGKAEAAGDEPFGCVIVLNGEVVVRERNHIHTANDPTAHAETSAIRAAARNLARGAAKTFRIGELSGCVLYTSWEPCHMCAATILYANVETVVMGGREGFPLLPDLGDYRIEKLLEASAQWGARFNLVTGVLQRESEQMVMDWWNRVSKK